MRAIAVNTDTLIVSAVNGVFKIYDSFVLTVDGDNDKPQDFVLMQVYPNPFNPSTTICYELPARGNVTLRVYNLLGQEVAKLVNKEQDPGTYRVQFDGTDLASGVYFYRMRAGDFLDTKKLLLLK